MRSNVVTCVNVKCELTLSSPLVIGSPRTVVNTECAQALRVMMTILHIYYITKGAWPNALCDQTLGEQPRDWRTG